MPNFIKIGQTVLEIWQFNRFQNGFWKFKFLTVWTVKRPNLHIRAKFRKDLPIRCCDIAIFVVFQDGGRRHLGFWKFKFFYRLDGLENNFA